jgi:hypothetical protein
MSDFRVAPLVKGASGPEIKAILGAMRAIAETQWQGERRRSIGDRKRFEALGKLGANTSVMPIGSTSRRTATISLA